MRDSARDLALELDWFARVLDARLNAYFGRPGATGDPVAIPPPSLEGSDSAWARFVRDHALPVPTRLVVLLALIPHLRPHLLDVLWVRNEVTQRGYTEFGGVSSSTHGGFVPSGETAAFLLAGDDLAERFQVMRLFEPGQFLHRHRVVVIGGPGGEAETGLSGPLVVSPEYVARFTAAAERVSSFGRDFPARRIETGLQWSDLVLPEHTLAQLDEIRSWVLHGETLLGAWGMRNKLRPGFTSLFYGPSGTGKTLSACLLGKHCGCEVYKIDLSLIVSKYIGETEKNLGRVFDRAEQRGWILFFDEADALFGRRTRVGDSHDRYANQEVSFLLQRIEEFDGVVILASNLKANIDDAFLRRFQSVVHFGMPRAPERLRLWEEAFSRRSSLGEGVDLERLAERHETTGGTIMNVVRYASLMALSRGVEVIEMEDLERGIRRELMKEGRGGG